MPLVSRDRVFILVCQDRSPIGFRPQLFSTGYSDNGANEDLKRYVLLFDRGSRGKYPKVESRTLIEADGDQLQNARLHCVMTTRKAKLSTK